MDIWVIDNSALTSSKLRRYNLGNSSKVQRYNFENSQSSTFIINSCLPFIFNELGIQNLEYIKMYIDTSWRNTDYEDLIKANRRFEITDLIFLLEKRKKYVQG